MRKGGIFPAVRLSFSCHLKLQTSLWGPPHTMKWWRCATAASIRCSSETKIIPCAAVRVQPSVLNWRATPFTEWKVHSRSMKLYSADDGTPDTLKKLHLFLLPLCFWVSKATSSNQHDLVRLRHPSPMYPSTKGGARLPLREPPSARAFWVCDT